MSSAVPTDRIDRHVWVVALTIVVGAMAVVFDGTIVSVALHDLTVSLHAPLGTIQWVSTAYLLAMFVTIPIAAWAQSAMGGRRLWILALGIFLGGSILCAIAWDATSLVVFRAVQGLGGGLILPLMTTLILQATGGHNIGRVMAAITLPTALGPIIGPVLGGLILAVGDWRWLFLVNIPFCVVGGCLAIRNLAKDERRPRQRLDVVGFFLISPGVIAVVFGLSRVASGGGFVTAGVLFPLGAGLVLLVGFVAWALRRRAAALIDLHLFRYRSLASGSLLGFLAAATLYGAMFLLPLYWQEADARSALETGLLLIPQSIGTLLSRRLAGNWTDKLGPRAVALLGFVIVTLATIPFAFVSRDTNVVVLLVALLIRGAGMGFAIIPLTGASFIGLAREEMPHASIIGRVAQQVGGSVGTAVIAVALTSASADASGSARLDSAFDQAFWWTIGCTALAAPLCLLLPGRVERVTQSLSP